jgi:hypothetical protein
LAAVRDFFFPHFFYAAGGGSALGMGGAGHLVFILGLAQRNAARK